MTAHRRIHIRKRPGKSVGGDILLIIFLALMGTVMALPLIFAVGNAFKPLEEYFVFPPHFIPRAPTLQNFKDLSNLLGNSLIPFSRYLFNTVFVTVVGTAGLIILGSMCAFPLAKRKFPGSRLIFVTIVGALMFNGTVTSTPSYVIMTKLGLVDNYLAIILPAFCLPIGLYIMKQFIEQMVPDSLLEAAQIDGASDMTMFWRIVMPIVRPAWLTLMLFSIQQLWMTGNSLLLYSEEMKPLSYALSLISTSGLARAGVGGAVNFIMMSIPILVFILTQSNVTEAMSTSGMKD